MSKLIHSLLILITILASLTSANARELDEGIEYKRLRSPVPVQTPGKIEVVELFWYGCPHCFHLEPDMHDWLKKKPDNVEFIRIPAIFNKTWALHAKAFYTSEFLEVMDKVHPALFNAMNVKKQKMGSAKAIRKLFIDQGIDGEKFDSVFNSFAVDAKVRRAKELSKRYKISGVPALVVNGQYLTDGPMAGGRKGMIEVLNYLIKKESSK